MMYSQDMISNILTNAVKYTHEGYVRFCVGFKKDGSDEDSVILKVSVRDTGIGIKDENLSKLFTEFERIDEERNRNIEGSGLGMNITLRLLELMGSTLNVESVYGVGSEFSFELKQKVRGSEVLGDYEESYKKALDDYAGYRKKFEAPKAKLLVVDDNQMSLWEAITEAVAQFDYDEVLRLLDGLQDITFDAQNDKMPCNNKK